MKGGIFIEVPASLNAIAFDKTGTLTIGRPSVLEVIPLNGHSAEELLLRAASMEVHSDHPLAQAIVRFAAEQGIKTSPAESFQILPGKGASALFDGRPFWLGSHRYLEERAQETPEVHAQIEQMSAAGRTVVVIGNDKHVCGFITLADEVRPQCREILHRLRGQGIQHLIMLTGDNEATAREIAKITGIDEFAQSYCPRTRSRPIEALVAKYGTVAMVGDGVNDAPALGLSHDGNRYGGRRKRCRTRNGRRRLDVRRLGTAPLVSRSLAASGWRSFGRTSGSHSESRHYSSS